MSHWDSIRLHRMTLDIIMISDIIIIVVAHFLLATSLTVTHGLRLLPPSGLLLSVVAQQPDKREVW